MSQTRTTPPPIRFDGQGRMIPFTPAERAARAESLRLALEAMEAIDDDPAEDDREFFRALDSHRPERPLFEGRY